LPLAASTPDPDAQFHPQKPIERPLKPAFIQQLHLTPPFVMSRPDARLCPTSHSNTFLDHRYPYSSDKTAIDLCTDSLEHK
jgi:hypothetical protein